MKTPDSFPEGVVDHAIVGAGVSGLYAAWRLLSANPATSIAGFESLPEEGGRLCSVPMPGLPFVAEVGGMRFRETHVLLSNLVRRFKLPTGTFEFPLRSAFARGRFLSPAMLQHGACETCNASIPFSLGRDAIDAGPAKLLLTTIYAILADLELGDYARDAAGSYGVDITEIKRIQDGLRSGTIHNGRLLVFTPRQWRFLQEHATLEGDPLYHLGFWSLIAQRLETEEFAFVRNLLGYETIVSNWNAAEALLWFVSDFADERYRHISAGYSSLTRRLRTEAERLGACFRFSSTLTGIRGFEKRSDGARFALEISGPDLEARQIVEARSVILAIPVGALRNVAGLSALWHEHGNDPASVLEPVSPQALFKLFLGFSERWWDGERDSDSPTSGRAVTDSPLRQVYYDASTWRQNASQAGASLVMASYSDAQFVSFWRPTPKERRSPPYYLGDWKSLAEADQEILWRYGSDERMVRIALDLLAKLHPAQKIPQPVVALYRDWREAPFYGGWHTWNAGVKAWAIRESLAMPIPGLHVCNEAFSSDQGWVEGSLRSTERVLHRIGIGRPDGLEDDSVSEMGYESLDQYLYD